MFVHLQSLDGLFVDLVVTSYQFGRGQSSEDEADWDANWLMIRGKAWDGAASWEFHEPCMTTWETRELASWLRGLGGAVPKTITATDPAVVRFWMTEPNLMFTLAATSMGIVTPDVHFDAELRPPGGSNDDKAGLGHRVPLTIPQADLAVAVGDWERDLIAFPVR